mmetsp:Transcript_3788/g.7361  ORF Transcript_3788/g.7361 Transcript_3788/m.7361 type:complete len:257 (+) Transcript_3788:1150-1920(+)
MWVTTRMPHFVCRCAASNGVTITDRLIPSKGSARWATGGPLGRGLEACENCGSAVFIKDLAMAASSCELSCRTRITGKTSACASLQASLANRTSNSSSVSSPDKYSYPSSLTIVSCKREPGATLGAAAAMTSAAEHVLVPRVRPCVVACFPAPAHRASNGRSCSWISTFMNKDPSIAAFKMRASWTTPPAAISTSIRWRTASTAGVISSGMGLAPFFPTAIFLMAMRRGAKSDSLFNTATSLAKPLICAQLRRGFC